MLRGLEEGKFTVEEVCYSEVVQRISEKLKHRQKFHEESTDCCSVDCIHGDGRYTTQIHKS